MRYAASIEFYASIGKKPIHLRKEVVGHVANRLQAAIYREVVNLINLGVVDVADADTAVCWGPGLRWGVMGPSMLFHLGGGEGGIQHFMEHLSGPVAMWWKDLGGFTEWPDGQQGNDRSRRHRGGERSARSISWLRCEMRFFWSS